MRFDIPQCMFKRCTKLRTIALVSVLLVRDLYLLKSGHVSTGILYISFFNFTGLLYYLCSRLSKINMHTSTVSILGVFSIVTDNLGVSFHQKYLSYKVYVSLVDYSQWNLELGQLNCFLQQPDILDDLGVYQETGLIAASVRCWELPSHPVISSYYIISRIADFNWLDVTDIIWSIYGCKISKFWSNYQWFFFLFLYLLLD